ncbi:DNA-binding protein [Burkholderia cenocepacia]|uniref:DNA-binding protein n=1 Tax=Burkholderia cenocepacia TaxID=95486 RepID=UPI002ABE9AFA|nr:DNA-binding protein [Burkholderia cenocepacia]
MALTKEQVFAAADELDGLGQSPTLAAVRKLLGTGSFTTISEAMNEWRSSKAAKAAPIREPAPQAIADRLGELGVELWAVALDLANGRLATEREALEAARVELEAARQEAAELADQLTGELDEAKGRIDALLAVEAASKTDSEALRGDLAAAVERTATAEARAVELRTELDHAHREVRDLRAEHDRALERAHAERDRAIRALADAHAERNTALEQVKTSAGQVEAMRDELVTTKAKADAEREAHAEQRKAAAQEVARQAERFTNVQAERDEARKAAGEAQRDAGRAREEAATLRGELHAVKEQYAELLKSLKASKDKASGRQG